MSKTKVCTKCNHCLPFTDFSPMRRGKDGRAPRCKACGRDYIRLRRGNSPRNFQQPSQPFTFSCGCSGVLPKQGQSNQFACGNSRSYWCRVAHILKSSNRKARERHHKPVSADTAHSVIRAMMANPNCERCGQRLVWEFGVNKTPHLHHNHETGQPLGFTHPHCNPQAMEQEIERQRDEIASLKARLASFTLV
jgi:hypothetical protein